MTGRKPGRHNRAFSTKRDLRIDAVDLTGREDCRVLDCFAGTGALWRAVRQERPLIDVDHIEIDRAVAVGGAMIGDNLNVMAGLDLDVYDVIDLDAFGWPDKQLALIAERRAGRLPVVTATCCGQLYTAVPRLVTDAVGIPRSWPPGVVSRGHEQWWDQFLASLGWGRSIRWRASRGGGWARYEVLVPPGADAGSPRGADRRGRAPSPSGSPPTA